MSAPPPTEPRRSDDVAALRHHPPRVNEEERARILEVLSERATWPGTDEHDFRAALRARWKFTGLVSKVEIGMEIGIIPFWLPATVIVAGLLALYPVSSLLGLAR